MFAVENSTTSVCPVNLLVQKCISLLKATIADYY